MTEINFHWLFNYHCLILQAMKMNLDRVYIYIDSIIKESFMNQ